MSGAAPAGGAGTGAGTGGRGSALLDTHLLLWAATGSPRLPAGARAALADARFRPVFSVASLWEVTIKAGLGRADFRVDAAALRRGLLAGGYDELPIRADHVLRVARLPPHHADPFDRVLLAQAAAEGLPLWTADAAVLRYGAPAAAV